MHPHSHTTRILLGVVLVFAIGLLLGIYALTIGQQNVLLQDNSGLVRASIAGTTIFVKVADTPEERQKGLGGATSLGSSEGMLFLFSRNGYYSIWMRDMYIPIDIVWLSEEGIVIHVEKDVHPDSYPKTFTSPVPARSVLELPAGFLDRHSVEMGDRVTVFQ